MTAAEIFALMGRPVVLLKVERKTKRCLAKEWQKTTLADMTEQYLAGLNGDSNIGILHGAASGKLIGIEWDDQELAKAFCNANPALQGTLASKAKRGACLWVFIAGQYPKAGKFKVDGKEAGEWRADGMQTVFSGIHPEGMEYKNNGNRPTTVRFEDIVWPDGITLPWMPKPAPAAAIPEPEVDIHSVLVAKCGLPYLVNDETGKISALNQSYFVQRFVYDHLILFELSEAWFYLYRDDNGAWVRTEQECVKALFRAYWEHLKNDVFREPQLSHRNTNSFENSIVDGIKAFVGRRGVFKTLKNVIHARNAMLHLEGDTIVPKPFSPEYYSRNPIDIDFVPGATCPLFETQILSRMTNPADRTLFGRYFGNVLLGGNASERILILVGKTGTSKSTLVKIIEFVLGRTNFIELRTQYLDQRFEIGRYVGKTLLTGKDVKGDFLETEGAQALLKLTGHDTLSGEAKFSMSDLDVEGDKAILISTNATLVVNLESETHVGAWERRLAIINFEGEPHKERKAKFAETVFAAEKEGIFLWALQNAVIHLDELNRQGDFTFTDSQKARVSDLLAQSLSIACFVKERIFKQVAGEGLRTSEIVEAYKKYCEERAWKPKAIKIIERMLPDIMLEEFGVHVSRHIKRDGKEGRGYPDVAFAVEEQEDDGS